jgi:hypothetical protein
MGDLRAPNSQYQKRSISNHIVSKPLNIQSKERILKAAKEK